MLVSKPQPGGTTKDIHKVVLIIARQLYTDANDDNCFQVFHDIGSFFKFALSKKRSYFWAHNAQGYDSRLLFSNVSHISTLYKPSNIIMRGEKILQFCIKTTKFRDSMCHLSTSLDSLPKMLGFSGAWKKGFFPHKFNIPDNQTYIGPLPDRSFYEPEEMKEQRKDEFERWYLQEQMIYQKSNWDFQENLVEYCKADVMVLSKALEIYDTLMKELNDEISPLTNITFAFLAIL